MADIHPTAVVDIEVELADDVTIGPGCVLSGPITVGPRTRLLGNVYLQGPLEIGADNTVYPFACLGFAPQHAKYDASTPGRGLVIGNGNTFREQVTIHRALTDDGPTRVGDGNMFMVTSHVGHDCQISDGCTFVNNCALAGHVTVADGVIVGGHAVVHQFVRIGRGVMISGRMGTAFDVPPWFLITGINICGSVNIVGLRRSGLSRDQIEDVRWIYRTLYREGLSVKGAVEAIREREGDPLVDEYIRFIESSDRGICPARGKAVRGTA